MIRATWSQRIHRPREQVFDYVSDLDNEPEWNPDASNVVRTTLGELGSGTVWEEDIRRVGHFATAIERYEPPHLVSFDARSQRVDARATFELAAVSDAATDLSCFVELTLKGPLRIVEPLVRGPIRRQMESSRGPLLKQALERRPTAS